jgi:hypothetical protein
MVTVVAAADFCIDFDDGEQTFVLKGFSLPGKGACKEYRGFTVPGSPFWFTGTACASSDNDHITFASMAISNPGTVTVSDRFTLARSTLEGTGVECIVDTIFGGSCQQNIPFKRIACDRDLCRSPDRCVGRGSPGRGVVTHARHPSADRTGTRVPCAGIGSPAQVTGAAESRMIAPMVERSLRAVLLTGVLGIGTGGVAMAAEPDLARTPSMILELINRPVESQEQAFNRSLRSDGVAPVGPGVDAWEPQPDGSMRNKKTGFSIMVRNPCPPGDVEHEFALAAYNRAMARSKAPR